MGPPRALVVWCPDWPLIAAGVDPAVPAAVVTSGRVTACTAAARSLGVRRGHRLRDAQRYCPDLAVHHEDPDGDARTFEAAAGAVEEICPRVEVIRPGLAAVPARGPSRYYGSEQVVAGMVRDAVIEHGFACAVGIADGTFTANLAARAAWAEAGEAGLVAASQPHDTGGRVEKPPQDANGAGGQGVRVVPSAETVSFLAPLPVSALERPELAAVLGRLGLRTLGALAALPVRDMLARFGTEGEIAHRLASGREARPPLTRPPGEELGAELTFDPPIAQSEPAVFAAKSLADRLHQNLADRGLMCVRVEVEAITDDGRSRSRLWRHDGLLSGLAVAERVRWQLDAWRTAGELTGDLAGLRLAPDQLVVDTGRQLALWGQQPINDQVARAAARVQVLLGHAGVTRPLLGGGRGPGEQVVRVPWGDAVVPPLAPDRPWPGRVPVPAPAVVHPQPRPVELFDADSSSVLVTGRAAVSAPPARLVVDGQPLDVTGWTGPWPVLEHWWNAALARRCARLQVVTDDGRGWLLMVEQGAWSVEAVYE